MDKYLPLDRSKFKIVSYSKSDIEYGVHKIELDFWQKSFASKNANWIAFMG